MTETHYKEFKEICRLIKENDVISFDVFDTALLRDVLFPTDIFDIVEHEIKKRGLNLTHFKRKRIAAEINARKVSNNEDITLNEIYNIFQRKETNVICDQIKEIELNIEKKFIRMNPVIKKVYDYAIANNKTVYFISDMYLSSDFISQLLKLNGYNSFEHVFVSNEVGLSKASSHLYVHLREKNFLNKEWLHIGDNYVSDYCNALQSNVNAYYYENPRSRMKIERSSSIEESIMRAIQINYCETKFTYDYWSEFGVREVSPILFGFTLWLTDNLKNKDNIFFLSRDGYLPYKIYEMFKSHVDSIPEARYIYASRRVYQIPNILNMTEEEGLELITAYNNQLGQKLTLREIFRNLDLDSNRFEELLGLKKVDLNQVIDSEESRNNVKEILRGIYPIILKSMEKEKDVLNKYLLQAKLYNYKEVNIVDVGWRGSTQKAIKDITRKVVNGYYFGTTENVYDDLRQYVNGYAFNLGRPLKNAGEIMNNVMMYEFIFSAPHGSLVGLNIDKGGEVLPVLSNIEKNEFLKESTISFQTSVIEVTKQYLKYFEYLKNTKRSTCLKNYYRFIESRKYKDLVEFERLSAVVGIGASEESQRYVTRASLDEFFINKKEFRTKASRNLWRNAVILYGSFSEVQRVRGKNSNCNLNVSRVKEKMIKAILDPKKAMRYFLRRFRTLVKKK